MHKPPTHEFEIQSEFAEHPWLITALHAPFTQFPLHSESTEHASQPI